MVTLFLTCGLPGSGKATLARRLETEAPAPRLTADEWLHARVPGITTHEAETAPFRARVEDVRWPRALAALGAGSRFALDRGVWGRAERDRHRVEARSIAARVKLRRLDPPGATLWLRLAHRNAARTPGALEISRADLARWSRAFERPTAEELALFDAPDDLDARAGR